MKETENEVPDDSLMSQARQVVRDGVDYAASALRLLQAQATSLALSSVAFLLLVFFGIIAGITAFVLLSIALGMWLTQVTGHAGWALLIMGGVYMVLAIATGGVAVRWLRRLNS